jgi:hypothetical protein
MHKPRAQMQSKNLRRFPLQNTDEKSVCAAIRFNATRAKRCVLLSATSVHHVISAQWDRRKMEIMLFDNVEARVISFYSWRRKSLFDFLSFFITHFFHIF